MRAAPRWTTLATLAVALSAGPLLASACVGGGEAKATPGEGSDDGEGEGEGDCDCDCDCGDGGADGEDPPGVAEDLAALEAEVEALREAVSALTETVDDRDTRVEAVVCVLRYLEDANQNGETSSGSPVDEAEVAEALVACGV